MLFHEFLRRSRLDVQLSQTIAATQLGVQRSTLQNWEMGASLPGINHLNNLAGVYRLEPSAFLPYLFKLDANFPEFLFSEVELSRFDTCVFTQDIQHLFVFLSTCYFGGDVFDDLSLSYKERLDRFMRPINTLPPFFAEAVSPVVFMTQCVELRHILEIVDFDLIHRQLNMVSSDTLFNLRDLSNALLIEWLNRRYFDCSDMARVLRWVMRLAKTEPFVFAHYVSDKHSLSHLGMCFQENNRLFVLCKVITAGICEEFFVRDGRKQSIVAYSEAEPLSFFMADNALINDLIKADEITGLFNGDGYLTFSDEDAKKIWIAQHDFDLTVFPILPVYLDKSSAIMRGLFNSFDDSAQDIVTTNLQSQYDAVVPMLTGFGVDYLGPVDETDCEIPFIGRRWLQISERGLSFLRWFEKRQGQLQTQIGELKLEDLNVSI